MTRDTWPSTNTDSQIKMTDENQDDVHEQEQDHDVVVEGKCDQFCPQNEFKLRKRERLVHRLESSQVYVLLGTSISTILQTILRMAVSSWSRSTPDPRRGSGAPGRARSAPPRPWCAACATWWPPSCGRGSAPTTARTSTTSCSTASARCGRTWWCRARGWRRAPGCSCSPPARGSTWCGVSCWPPRPPSPPT